jgi:hypothetical protein
MGRQGSAWPAFCGDIDMVERTALWEAELPMRSILMPNPVHPALGERCQEAILSNQSHPPETNCLQRLSAYNDMLQ